ncbi:cytochrome P450 CYP749A22-like [Punica granatum]|uniref:Cytochrome P450 CYP749A22-like n=1 Tax=Punica granatum TaxID=22663 RepID=A0A6P8EG73_PUNGR|nr:cytochrome P450 CYP749A22-like [Punica granatum]
MMLEKWEDHESKEIEVFEEFILLTSEVISRMAFGSSYIEGRNIFKIKIWKTADEIKGEKLEKGILDAILRIIEKREEKIASRESYGFGNDFLGLLVQAYIEEDRSKRITIDDLVDECKTFYLAGQETTSSMLPWTLFLLAIHTDWQEEVRKDMFSVFGRQDPQCDGFKKLKTLFMRGCEKHARSSFGDVRIILDVHEMDRFLESYHFREFGSLKKLFNTMSDFKPSEYGGNSDFFAFTDIYVRPILSMKGL